MQRRERVKFAPNPHLQVTEGPEHNGTNIVQCMFGGGHIRMQTSCVPRSCNQQQQVICSHWRRGVGGGMEAEPLNVQVHGPKMHKRHIRSAPTEGSMAWENGIGFFPITHTSPTKQGTQRIAQLLRQCAEKGMWPIHNTYHLHSNVYFSKHCTTMN